MPPFRPYLQVRDDTTSDSNSAGPGQRISVDGGMESKRGVIAMILAIVLFIVVIVIYQHLTTEMARREAEESSSSAQRRRRRSKHDDTWFIVDKVSALFDKCISFFKRHLSRAWRQTTPSPTTSHSSMEALLKIRIRPTRARQTFFGVPCLERRKESKARKAARLVPRPLLLNTDVGYTTYKPRSPIDEKTYEVLRSPDAFAEFSDPVRNMNFARQNDEIQRRREHDEIWYAEPINSPDRPTVACVAPLAFRRKTKEGNLLREGDDANGDWIPPSPERIIYPSRQTGALGPAPPLTPSSSTSTFSRESWDDTSTSYLPYSPRCLSTIDENTGPPTPRSFFEHDDEDDLRKRRRTFSLKVPFSLHKKPAPAAPIVPSPSKDPDIFSIGSYSSSEE